MQAMPFNLPTGSQDAQCNGQVKTTRVFGQVGRRQVNGNALVAWKLKARVLQGRAHPLSGFFDLDIGQPHQCEARQAIGQVHLHGDQGGLKAKQSSALHQRQTHIDSLHQLGAVFVRLFISQAQWGANVIGPPMSSKLVFQSDDNDLH